MLVKIAFLLYLTQKTEKGRKSKKIEAKFRIFFLSFEFASYFQKAGLDFYSQKKNIFIGKIEAS